jgi:hypothetical protein
MKTFAEHYITAGYTWAFGANGPQQFDCWHFVRMVQHEQFGRDLPSVSVAPGVGQQLLSSKQSSAWRLRKANEAPREGDIVEAHRPDDLHVGLWSEEEGGGMLHCNSSSGGPAWTAAVDLPDLFPRIRFWAYASEKVAEEVAHES